MHDDPDLSPGRPVHRQARRPRRAPFPAVDVAKSDIDVAAEAHVRECLASARLLMEKLYRRNPREWRKGRLRQHGRRGGPRIRSRDRSSASPSSTTARGADAVLLALKPDYAGDRVFAFGVGLASMVFLAYGEKTEFYLTDTLDPQKLYNSARNIEIAAWKLAQRARRAGSAAARRQRDVRATRATFRSSASSAR